MILALFWLTQEGIPAFLTSGEPAGDEMVEGISEEDLKDFVSVVLGSTEDVWTEIYGEAGQSYRAPGLVLFTNQVDSGCGFQSAATGPFYCPPDERVYIDLSFFRQLAALGGPGDFAAAYVIGHEVGHHVQNLSGTSQRVQQARSGAGTAAANALSVRLELQADCYAGVWANRTDRRGVVTLSEGDVDEGLEAARAIGDDRLQSWQGGRVQPESFTHGTSEERAQWLRRGLAMGDPGACDTFSR